MTLDQIRADMARAAQCPFHVTVTSPAGVRDLAFYDPWRAIDCYRRALHEPGNAGWRVTLSRRGNVIWRIE